MSEAALAEPEAPEVPQHIITTPHRPPYTVDDLFKMPDDGNRYEVLGGSLVVSPAPAPIHQLVADELCRRLWVVRPSGVRPVTGVAVEVLNRDGPIPDITVTSADFKLPWRELPGEVVHTVVEVTSPSNALVDRALKPRMYADAGVPCYWRVELNRWRAYRGPLPLIVVRLRRGDEWRTIEAAAGETADLHHAAGSRRPGAARRVTRRVVATRLRA
jgi:Uma2 family endonuclease